MYAKQNQPGTNNGRAKARTGIWLMGGALVVVAALAISVVIYNAPPKSPAQPANSAQFVPDADHRAVTAYLNGDNTGVRAVSGQTAPDGVAQAIARDLNERSASVSAQFVPDADRRTVMAYLSAQGATAIVPFDHLWIHNNR